ncbi:MAG: hypothetical protein BMS9Abin26_1150 [Gammaproteobacteria bacterium]|nr:MAG: hypothetical protein BMS9Abin26_1150 [Gammaproteobacteria bacterium]
MMEQSRLTTQFTAMATAMIITLTSLLWVTSPALAAGEKKQAEQSKTDAVPVPPPIPNEEDTIVPDVTIVEDDEGRIEKYSVNGDVYMIKITPKSGPAYYITDTDGDGILESRSHELAADFYINQWMIFSW